MQMSTAAAAPRQRRNLRRSAMPVRASAPVDDYRQRPKSGVRVLVVGATGYIGKFVVRELVRRGYDVVAFARERSGIGGKQTEEDVRQELRGAGGRAGAVGGMWPT
jgi:divinyl chlorophyllide a 8-vinyl-reductase